MYTYRGNHKGPDLFDDFERRSRPALAVKRIGSAKLTPDQVREIRSSTELLTTLAARYGVGRTTVSEIRKGATWGHIA